MSSPTVTAPPGFADLEPLSHDQQKDTSETSCSASYHSSSPPQTTKSKHKTSAQGKKSLFSSLTHKFGHKSKAKAIPSPGESKRQQPVGHSVEDGFVMVSHEVVPRHQDSLGECTTINGLARKRCEWITVLASVFASLRFTVEDLCSKHKLKNKACADLGLRLVLCLL